MGSKRFFQFVLIFFFFEAGWIALSAAYPQAFDEAFHFGLIKVYSHYWLPFLAHQPPHANAYGAVARDPSYLYHYLMSFPYRLIALFVHNSVGQIILMRFINVGLFATGLVLLRRVLLRVKLSPQLTNISLFIFVLIPIVPQLAGQINYDNMLIPLVSAACLLAFNALDQIKERRPSARTLLTLLTLCIFASLVKYEFLPVFAGIALFLTYYTWRTFHGSFHLLKERLHTDWQRQSRRLKAMLIIAVLISAGMFMQRDGYNLIKYHTFSPNCANVLSVKACSAYSVWAHDYKSHQLVVEKVAKVNSDPFYYVGQWVYWLWYRLFFAVNGPKQNFHNYPPLPLPSAAFMLIGLAGLFSVFKWRRRLFRDNPYFVMLGLIAVIYLVALFIDGYIVYEYTDVLELMNGRYLLPILPLAAAIIGSALSIALRKSPRLKVAVAIAALILFLEGGGFLTFITRSDSNWYWNNHAVIKVNNAARHITKKVIVHGKKSYKTPLWFFN